MYIHIYMNTYIYIYICIHIYIHTYIGGTGTMIGDPPNIIIGNMLAKYLDFNAFLANLGASMSLALLVQN